MSLDRLISDRARAVNGSGIREVFALRDRMRAEGKDPVDLSIGQPHFPVPDAIKKAAIDAISADRNGYTANPGIPEMRRALASRVREDTGWMTEPLLGAPGAPASADANLILTSGTSGGLALAFLALLSPGDEAIIPDPFFVAYPHLATMCHAKAVICNTYPDCRMTAARVEPLITPKTKLVLLNSPGNPSGIVATKQECADLLELCRRKNIVLISDEIYDLFTYTEARTDRAVGGSKAPACPSPARIAGSEHQVLLIRGFGKTYGITGWRLGYAAGPKWLLESMNKLQQYLYVCAPTPLQWGALAALDVDMTQHVAAYQRNRDAVVKRLSPLTELAIPGGAFYAFPKVPERLGMTGSQFSAKATEQGVLVVPGKAFSTKDTHFRISFATDSARLERGLDVLAKALGA